MPAALVALPPRLQAARRPQAQRPVARRLVIRTAATADGAPAAAAQTVAVTLRKPMGLVLAERRLADGSVEVFVEELVAGGNAAKDGRVRAGDVLTRCSATLLKAGKEGEFEREGYGQRPYDNWERVMFDARGKQFDTVMAAIGSNSERWGIFDVSLEFSRPAAAGGSGGDGGSDGSSGSGSGGGS